MRLGRLVGIRPAVALVREHETSRRPSRATARPRTRPRPRATTPSGGSTPACRRRPAPFVTSAPAGCARSFHQAARVEGRRRRAPPRPRPPRTPERNAPHRLGRGDREAAQRDRDRRVEHEHGPEDEAVPNTSRVCLAVACEPGEREGHRERARCRKPGGEQCRERLDPGLREHHPEATTISPTTTPPRDRVRPIATSQTKTSSVPATRRRVARQRPIGSAMSPSRASAFQ